MKTMTSVRPTMAVLNQGQIDQVHEYSLKILSETGVRVDSDRARRLFARSVGPAAVDGDRVRIPRPLVEWALRAAPRAVDLYDRRGNHAFRLPGPPRFGIGVTALYYQDAETDLVVPFARQHMQAMVRLADSLPSYDVVSTVGIVQDVPPHLSDLYAALEMAANTAKPLVILVSEEAAFPAVLDLLDELRGEPAGLGGGPPPAARPFVVPYLNPISPLVINQGTIDKLWSAADRGLPVIYSNYGMSGASTPITPAGVLALLNAELLAGLALGQLICEGTPMILGSLPAYFDMKGKGSFYSSQSYLVSLACAEMMDHYGLPHAGTSGAGMGWGPDVIAAGHQWTNHLLSCTGKAGLVPFVGDNLSSMAFSPALVVYADEVIAQARLFAAGLELDDESVALDEIAQAGPGGTFLTSPSTLKLFRRAYFRSKLLPSLTLEEWQARGCPRAEEVLRRYTAELLAGLAEPPDYAGLVARGEAFIAALEARSGRAAGW